MSLRSGAQVAGGAAAARATRWSRSTSGPELVAQLRDGEPDVAFIALHGARRRGRHRAGAARGDRRPLHRLGAGGVHALHRQGAREVPDARGRHSHAGVHRVQRERRSRSSGAAARSATSSGRSASRWSSSRPSQGSALGVKFARSSEELPGGDRRRVLLRPQGPDRALRQGPRPGGLGARRATQLASEPLALPVVEAIPREEDFYNYESRYEIGMTTFVCPAELAPRRPTRAPRSWRSRRTSCSAATASRAST